MSAALVLDLWLLHAAWSELATDRRRPAGFVNLVSALAYLVAAAALTWLSAAVAVCVAAETGRLGRRLAGPVAAALAPRGLRLLVRLVCGVAIAGPLGTLPATAVENTAAGCGPTTCTAPPAALPLPDRPDVVADQRGEPAVAVPAGLPAAAQDVVTVRPGDSLWSIAAAHLPQHADADDVAAAWPRWYRANRAVVGPDPDLIHPGTELVVPEHPAARSTASPDH